MNTLTASIKFQLNRLCSVSRVSRLGNIINTIITELNLNTSGLSTANSNITTLQNGGFTGSSRWDDITFPLVVGKPTAGGKPDFDYTECGYLFPRNDTSEILIARVQIPHKWKEGSTVHPHVHIRQKRNEQIVFKIAYKWYNNGDTEPADWTVYPMDQYAFTYTSGSLAQIVKGAGIAGTGKKVSSMFLIKLYRDDNVYAGDILTDDFDIHGSIDSTGSTLEYIK